MVKSKDAFSVLMKPKPAKKRRTSNISFLPCPVCSKHISSANINNHLDKCMQAKEQEDAKQARRLAEARTMKPEPSATMKSPPSTTRAEDGVSQRSTKAGKPSSSSSSSSQSVDISQSVFVEMMKQSKAVFHESTPVQHCFFLDHQGQVHLHTKDPPETRTVRWSEAIRLRDRFARDATDDPVNSRPVEVTISTSMPLSRQVLPRYVQRHSQLSVPVLKSVLQKCVRRRRPLPAVRVAMELADKSLGELLRRLPIIVLEDSTYHPNLPFLVWLMMAHSKDYPMSRTLLQRVFQIVFQVSSCQWVDRLPSATNKSEASSEPLLLHKCKDDDLSVWSILARASYGGMHGDIDMLQRFARLWKERQVMTLDSLSLTVRKNLQGQSNLSWKTLPIIIHEHFAEQSRERVAVLCTNAIEALSKSDVCVEGVDFHCSAVLDAVVGDPRTLALSMDLLLLSGESVPSSRDDRRALLERIGKSCMWDFASGINRRQRLTKGATSDNSESKLYENLWKELLEPAARKYQTQYIEQRLYHSK